MLGILSLTSFILVLRADVVAKLVILGILSLTSLILALTVVLVISVILFSIFFYLRMMYIFFSNIIFNYITWLT